MYEVHTTRDGDQMLIGQMEDSHLFHTIKLHAANIQKAQAALMNSNSMGLMTEILSGADPKQIREQATESIKMSHSRLTPYVCEAALRGMNISPILQQAYGRTSAIPTFSTQFQLNGSDSVDDLDDAYYPREEDY
jgi:hypothetical protein